MKYIIILTLLVTSVSCQNIKSKKKMNDQYQWRVSANAPVGFPATIYYGDLNGSDIRGDGVMNNGWGLSGSATTGSNVLPKSLDLVWFSYLENQFYKGQFTLDQKKIKDVFEEGYKDDILEGIETFHDFHFVVNVAPGGTVALWMKGLGNFQKEVGFFKAEKTDIKWKDFVPMGLQSREEYVRLTLEEDLDKTLLAHYKNNGIPFERWKNYRKYFNIKTSMPSDYEICGLSYDCFNGERFYGLNSAYNINNNYTSLPIPKEIILNWYEKDSDYKYVVVLNIKENQYQKMLDFFKTHDKQAEFYAEPHTPLKVREIKLFLKSGSDRLELELDPYSVSRKMKKK